jgi:transposase-like protein
MMKSCLERMLNSEMHVHLGRSSLGTSSGSPSTDTAPSTTRETGSKRSPNRRNGRSRKTVQGDLGEVPIETTGDRDGSFESQLIGKLQRRVLGFDEKILAL